MDVAASLGAARRRIARAGGDPEGVRIVAVTKGFGPDAVTAAVEAGLADVGENYAQELLAKHEALAGVATPDAVRWHFLGHIQRNKVARLSGVVSCWQSVARLEEGTAIARRAPGARVLVEVDASGAPGRNGCAPGDAAGLVDGLRAQGLDVQGLMTVAPQTAAAREVFATVRRLADDLGLVQRSMGMSDDLELAVAEGSTMVRLGRALFGERPAPGGRETTRRGRGVSS